MQPERPTPSGVPVGRWLALTAAAIIASLVYSVYSGMLNIPERFNPWAPLDAMETPGFLTSFKLSRARGDAPRCLAALEQTSMKYDLLPDRSTGPGCGFENAVRLRSATVSFGAPLSMSCPMALSFFMWERHALQNAAQANFGRRVAAIDHFGSYACRNINRGEGAASEGSRSQHATANALDVSAFILEDGRRISVTQWQDPKDPAAARWLQQAHAGACRYFKGVLGPDYNAAHRDHFHLETGGYSMCR